MSSFGVGLGSWKKGGRVADSSAVTENIRRVAQGQADATYETNQKKNPFRLSSAILNGYAYNGAALVRKNETNSATSSDQGGPGGPGGSGGPGGPGGSGGPGGPGS